MSCSNTWKTKCLSVWYRSEKQPSPEPARPPAPGSTPSLRHQWTRFIPSALLPVPSGLMRDGARCPRGALPSAPAPYRHVACFPASASNGRSRFPSSRLPRSILPQVDGPWGRGEMQAVASDCCSVEHLFKINLILPSKCDLWNATTWPPERGGEAGRTEPGVRGSRGLSAVTPSSRTALACGSFVFSLVAAEWVGWWSLNLHVYLGP